MAAPSLQSVSSQGNLMDPAECVKMILQVVSLVRMLLFLAGVKSHPGPNIFRAFLEGKPLPQESFNLSSCSMVCSNGTLEKLKKYLNVFEFIMNIYQQEVKSENFLYFSLEMISGPWNNFSFTHKVTTIALFGFIILQ